MQYLLTFRTPLHSGSDDCEGSRRASIDMHETSERFEAKDEGDALAKALQIMQKRSLAFQGKEYKASAIALYQVIDISAFASAR